MKTSWMLDVSFKLCFIKHTLIPIIRLLRFIILQQHLRIHGSSYYYCCVLHEFVFYTIAIYNSTKMYTVTKRIKS